MSDDTEILIIGAGPAGLGCALRLLDRGFKNFLLVEASGNVGGLSRSEVDDQGFVWDVGGHVLFSHYAMVDSLLDSLELQYLVHERKSYVRVRDRSIPYPFQNNLRHLAPQQTLDCLLGLYDRPPRARDDNFAVWIADAFGSGIADLFMTPYNQKVWATDPQEMDTHWISERVPIVDFRSALANVVLARDDISWGPNSTFRFPVTGGTGAMFRQMAARLGSRLRLNTWVAAIDPRRKRAVLDDGSDIGFSGLVTSAPLDQTIVSIAESDEGLKSAASQLKHNSVLSVGIGFSDVRLDEDTCWVYFPQRSTPFYRATFFSNYSPHNTPMQNTSSVMCEVAFPSGTDLPPDEEVVSGVIDGLMTEGILSRDQRDKIVTTHVMRAPYAYPIPTLGYDRAARYIRTRLRSEGVISCGRFGSWSYEYGNMDHSLMQGAWAAEAAGSDLRLFAREALPEEDHWVFGQLGEGQEQ